MDNNNTGPLEGMSYYEILQAIYNGTLDPKIIPLEVRQALVQVLMMLGQEHIKIAKTFKVTDRTIRRDIEDIWELNSLYRDPDFTRKFAGEMRLRIMSTIEMLTRISHSSDAKVLERILAAGKIIHSLNALLQALQSLGYLPSDNRRTIYPDNKDAIVNKMDSAKTGDQKGENKNAVSPSKKRKQKLMRRLELLHPQERERIRHKLYNEILRNCEQQAEEEKDSILKSNPETPPKDDEEPGAGCGALAT